MKVGIAVVGNNVSVGNNVVVVGGIVDVKAGSGDGVELLVARVTPASILVDIIDID